MTITLTPEIEMALSARAKREGVAPESLALQGLRGLYFEENEGASRITGSRIKIAQIAIEHTRQGLTLEQIVLEHPSLTLSQVNDALAYYYSHRDALEAEIAASLAYADQARQEAGPSFLKERLLARRNAS